jgi:S1-C subfamily serine protease
MSQIDDDRDLDLTGVLPTAEPQERTRPPRGSGPRRRAEWRRAEKARRYAARKSVRFPVFTRSILLWWLVFALTGVAFGASGAFFWAHFNSQVAELREDTRDFEERSLEAQNTIETQRQEALAQIDEALKPLQGFLSESQMLQLAQLFSPAVYSVATLDENGFPSTGTAFAVLSDPGQTFLVTSHATVRASTVRPGPRITLRKGTDEIEAELWNWDAERDLALLRIARGDVPLLDWVGEDQAGRLLGTRVFPVSGLGGPGASITTGMVIDQSAVGFQHTAPLGPAFQGGPVVNVDGKVVGVASLAYRPLGFDPGQIHFSVPVSDLCQKLLSCGITRQAGPRG